MTMLVSVIISIVILLHIYFLVIEMFLWDKLYGRKTFGLNADFAKESKTLAANQGLYNGFLAAGLIWGLWLGESGFSIKVFFLACVVVAGIFGGLTVNKKIFFIQAIPAMLGLALLFAG